MCCSFSADVCENILCEAFDVQTGGSDFTDVDCFENIWKPFPLHAYIYIERFISPCTYINCASLNTTRQDFYKNITENHFSLGLSAKGTEANWDFITPPKKKKEKKPCSQSSKVA